MEELKERVGEQGPPLPGGQQEGVLPHPGKADQKTPEGKGILILPNKLGRLHRLTHGHI